MKKHFQFLTLLLAACFALAALPAAGQRYFVTGRAVDDSLRLPVPFLAAQLFLPDSTLYAVSLTDSLGRFSVETDRPADYELLLTGTGFDPVRRPVRLTAGAPRVDLGDVPLHDRTIHLAEAAVTGKASTLTVRRDTFVYSSKTMSLDPGASLSAMLSQMPGVTMDEEGNIRWQGKKVESILVNGQRFLGGDLQTLLRNLPAEVVENLKLYDKRSEEAERTGVDDGGRTTVMDVGIKPEYRGAWAGNVFAGGGYDGKWTGRAFVSNFSKRLQVGLSGLANNLNGLERVSPNGEWYDSGWQLGWNTYRNASASLDWTNRDDKSAAGYQHLSAGAYWHHDNTDYRCDTQEERFQSDGGRVWWNERERMRSRRAGWTWRAAYEYNLDSLNFLTASYDGERSTGVATTDDRSATFLADPAHLFPGDAIDQAFAQPLPDSTRRLLVNTMEAPVQLDHEKTSHTATLRLDHRFARTRHLLSLTGSVTATGTDYVGHNFYGGRYFTDGERYEPERLYNPTDKRSLEASATLAYRHSLTPTLWWNTSYAFRFTRTRRNERYYRLETLAGWADLERHPVGDLPEGIGAADSLLNDETNYATELQRRHALTTGLSGTVGRLETDLGFTAAWQDEALHYDRPGVLQTVLPRHEWTFYASARLKYAFSDRTSLEGAYRGVQELPELRHLLPVVWGDDPTSPTAGNPDLKSSWTDQTSLRFNTFFEPSQLSLSAGVSYHRQRNAFGYRSDYDAATGYYTQHYANIDGNRGVVGSVNLTYTIDRRKRWTLNADWNIYSACAHQYISTGEEVQLNRCLSQGNQLTVGLTYRTEGFNATLLGGVETERDRYRLVPSANIRGLVGTYALNVAYTFPWGTRLSSNFQMTSRRHFRPSQLNTDEPVWSASLSHDFLRSKQLTLHLKAVDILQGQKDYWASAEADRYTATSENGFERYVILGIVYRFGKSER